MKAQMARGADFESVTFAKAKALIPLLVPLFLSAFRRADDLAMAWRLGVTGAEKTEPLKRT